MVAPTPTDRSDRRVVIFDVETTGTDKRADQVIELCVQLGCDDGAPSHTWRIKPSVAIGAGAQAVHGISMKDLEGCPGFGDVAADIREVFRGAEVLVGYNLAFDIDMLQAEYERLGQPPLELADKQIIDPFRLWQQCEPRSLMDAHRRFVGQAFEAAHSATADVAATGRVLRGMVAAFGLVDEWSEIARVCEPERATWIGPSRHLRWNDDGHPVLSFGKHAGVPLTRLAADPEAAGYLRWVMDKDFPSHVRAACRRAFELDGVALVAWLVETHGAPRREERVRVEAKVAVAVTAPEATVAVSLVRDAEAAPPLASATEAPRAASSGRGGRPRRERKVAEGQRFFEGDGWFVAVG